LIERDRAFYLSPKAPEYVFFAPGSIDGRHPASAEGPLWPLFLQRYEPVERRYDLLVLRKRQQPLLDLLKEPIAKHVKLGESVSVPPTGSPMFVKIDVKYSVLGRLAELLFKPPEVRLRTTYVGGSTEDYRLIPEIGREGSILVPTIRSPVAFLRLYGVGTGNSPRPVSFEVAIARRGAWAYQSDILVSFAEIDTEIILKAESLLPKGGLGSSSSSAFDAIVEPDQLGSALLQPSLEGIFAHAPSDLVIDIGEATSINLGFGLRDGAWQGEGDVKGACFVVLDDEARELFSRCLDPKNLDSDRGPQSARVSIPAGTGLIKLSTTCVKTCDWAWSYWSRAELVPAAH
jgi:hypothetical protein